nr:penicillin-binding transpeptidase domain-containing protein [Rufibacter ruber]
MKPYRVLLPLLLFVSTCLCRAQDLQQPFKDCQLEGSITVYDYHQKRWIYSDSADAHRASLPASTFKIPHSLIALETGAVKDEHEVFPWDGTPRKVAAWNGDTDMKNAFANSTVWFYVRLAERLGNSTYRRYFKRMNYGNGKMAKAQGQISGTTVILPSAPENRSCFCRSCMRGSCRSSNRTCRR